MTVFFDSIHNEFILKHRNKVEFGSYLHNGMVIPNSLGLIYWTVTPKDWRKYLKLSHVIKIGKL